VVNAGARIGLIGPNGSGKSTLLEILHGRVKPDSGTVALRKGTRLSCVLQISEFAQGETIRSIIEGALERAKAPDGERFTSCTIITTRPNELVGPIHDRMPVILPRESWDRWLSREVADPAELTPLLAPAADDTASARPGGAGAAERD